MSSQSSVSRALDGAALADGLRTGIYRLFSSADHLNKINVFPVPDGDTGTNMAMTMSAVLASLDSGAEAHAGKLLAGAADAAIDGGRGNSGAIMAQWLLGLADRTVSLATLSPRDFALATVTGAKYARDAMEEPREGTLLTLLTDFSRELEAELERRSPDELTFDSLFQTGLARARRSLAETPEQLDVLRSANVVDAGAQGFVELIEGWGTYVATGVVGARVESATQSDEAMSVGGIEGDHRFCTECVISADAIDQRRLRELMSTLGGSLVVAGTRRKTRVHVHTNDPERVFETAREFGEISARKADDMHRQSATARHASTRKVAIVADTGADIPDAMLESLDIHLVPIRVHFGSRSYLDRITLSSEAFYEELARSPDPPRTSQPPPGDFRRMFEFLASHFDHVVCVDITSKVSGTYAAARLAAQHLANDRVTVIDSGNASLGQGLLAILAAECAAAGFDGPAVVAAVRAARARTHTFGLLIDLDYAVRGGRVPSIVRTFARWLRFSPVLTNHADGRIGLGGVIFGRKSVRRGFAKHVAKHLLLDRRYRIAVGHGNDESAGRALLEDLLQRRPNVTEHFLVPLGTALGAHGGPGMLVVGVQELPPATPTP